MNNIAQFEQNMKNKDLSVFKTEPIKLFAKQVVQYQDFKINSALDRMNLLNLSKTTARNYFSSGRLYIKTGKKTNNIGKQLYNYIDEFITQKLQPLMPAEKDRNIMYKYQKRNNHQIMDKEQNNEEMQKYSVNCIPDNQNENIKKYIELLKKEIQLKDEICDFLKKQVKNIDGIQI